MQTSYRECSGNCGGKRELLLKDIKLSQWNGEEHAIVRTGKGEGDELCKILLWCGKKAELVCCWEAACEEQTERASRRGGGLAADVFLGSLQNVRGERVCGFCMEYESSLRSTLLQIVLEVLVTWA